MIKFEFSTLNPFAAEGIAAKASYMYLNVVKKNYFGVFKVSVVCDTAHEHKLLTSLANSYPQY